MNIFNSLFSSSNQIKLISGLGNPGEKYKKTRHNVGFTIVDELNKALPSDFQFKSKFESEISESAAGGYKIFLVKPQTFMNKSGNAIQQLLNYYNIELDNVLIIHDDVDLKLNEMKMVKNAGSAGHKGVESIINHIGKEFNRLRVGIDNRKNKVDQPTDSYVLQNFKLDEYQTLQDKIIPEALSKIEAWIQN